MQDAANRGRSQATRRLALMGGVIAALFFGGLTIAVGQPEAAAWTAGITALCAVWWVTEPIPIPATSLVPFVLFPLAGVLDHKEVATAYGHSLILLLLGGFVLSTAMASSGAHKRIAVAMVRGVGRGGPRSLVLGFMLATGFLSMWISNTATTLMLLPVALAVLEQARRSEGKGPDEPSSLALPLLLGIAYAASIGGMGTPVGTPPNVIFMGVYREVTGEEISFLRWMGIGLPVVAILLPLTWWMLTRNLEMKGHLEVAALGPWRRPERRVLIVFFVTALLWVTRTSPFGGWSGLLGTPGVGDSTVALGAVVALFLLPDGEGKQMLDWETANEIPWGLLILFGGGIAIARAFDASGLSNALGDFLANDLGLATWPILAMMAVLCLCVTFMTEVTSNTASTTLLMPILAAAAVAAAIDPRLLMIPAALSASCAFMLPVATAPNAIVFGTGRVTTRQMARTGFWLNLTGVVVISLLCTALLGG